MIDNNTLHIIISSLSVSCATVITHPLDLIKVRLQLLTIQSTKRRTIPSPLLPNTLIISNKLTFNIIKEIVNNKDNGGLSGLFKGWVPALTRAFIYGGARLGLYSPIKNSINNIYDVNNNTVINITSALLSGALAAIIGNPLEVIKVRLQSGSNYNTNLLTSHRCITTTTTSPLPSLYSNLWSGTSMSATRSAILTASQIGPYTRVKRYLNDNTIISNIGVTVIAALISGILSTTLTSPFDVIKTRLMANTSKGGVYKVTKDLLKNEGVMALFKGWLPNYTRLGPQTMVTFIVYEELNKLYKYYNGINNESQFNVF